MKKVEKASIVILVTAFFSSCQSGKDAKQILSDSETRKDKINTIASDTSMNQEMMSTMMNKKGGMMAGRNRIWFAGYGLLLGISNTYTHYAFGALNRNEICRRSLQRTGVISPTNAGRCAPCDA